MPRKIKHFPAGKCRFQMSIPKYSDWRPSRKTEEEALVWSLDGLLKIRIWNHFSDTTTNNIFLFLLLADEWQLTKPSTICV